MTIIQFNFIGCGMGKWGADCSKACSSECLTCNPINGDCGLPRAGKYSFSKLVPVIKLHKNIDS
jgi:hypothetical protein